ncbi:MAG: membrane protein insertase YidC [Bdellovibrio sp.]|nr:membrane protein insertase YidC [Bdellovibrio sp.]
MDRKTILAVILCLGIYVGWQKLYLEPKYTKDAIQAVQPLGGSAAPQGTNGDSVGTAPKAPVSAPSSPVKKLASQAFPLETSNGFSAFGNGSHALLAWDLKEYKLGIQKDAANVSLQSVIHEDGAVSLAFEDSRFAYLNDIIGRLGTTATGATWNYSDENIVMSREIVTSLGLPYADVKLTAEFKTQPPKYAFVSLNAKSPEGDAEEQDRQFVYWTNQSLERVQIKDISQKEVTTPIHYIGATNRYFLMALVAQTTDAPSGLIQPTGSHAGRISMVYPVVGKTLTIPLRVYFGPKELNVLRSVDAKLDHTIDFGWFTVFAYPLLKILKWFYGFFENYGLAIILLTLLLKIATYPLTYKSMKSMKKMAKLQPQLQKLREKYKDDREALNREMLSMMKNHGYNPMAGCIPILIQMPIFFALYRVLYSSIELYHAPFALWIHDLSSRDPFYVTPVLLAGMMFVQQKLTPNTATDPAQARMMQIMPLIFGAFMLALPSGLTIYMLVNSLASIVQQMILNKKLDPAPAR